jgi:signal transduction histidine kinase
MSRPSVLNVDDNGGNRYVKSRTLRSAGFHVIEAATGKAAVDLTLERRPDVVLLDLKLPDISGFDVCRILKNDAQTSHIPIVHISSTFVGEETKAVSAQAGAEIYLAEPVAPHELTSAVRTVLRLHTAERTLARTEAELREALEQARAAQHAAEEAGRVKDEFLAILSHELRTPMTAVLGWLRVMRTAMLSPEQHANALEIVERNAQLQVQLVNDLLDVSRIITGKLELEQQIVPLDHVLRNAVESARPAAAARALSLELAAPPGAWAVRGSAGRLAQVVGNVLANAVKFSRDGGRVEVRLARRGGRAVVTVRDEGEGMSPELLPHVFDSFRQADGSARRRHGGLGLGLAIVKSLVELHGGQVYARSDGPDKGSEFAIELPLLDAALAGSARGETLRPREPSLKGVRILVVDDQADHRELVAYIVSEKGAAARTAGTADEAVQIAREWRPDVAVLDVGMPAVDGYQLLLQLRQSLDATAQSLPALALSGFAAPSDAAQALRAGFQAHLAKPFVPAALVAAIAGLVESCHAS